MSKHSYAQSIRLAIADSMRNDESVICYGLGVTDPKGVFGTTLNLHKEFGDERVFDMPTSENAMTGIGVGASIMGYKVLMTHQRLDFFLLGLDQLVNSAAKIRYMYGGEINCPITIRLIIGRGWGQGPTHSQNLQAWFAHIPGLKVVMPTFPSDAYNLLRASIQDPDPVIFLEHRWLHNTKDIEPDLSQSISIGSSRCCKNGVDYTLITTSYLTLEGLKAARYLEFKYNLSVEVIDLVSIKPIDYQAIKASAEKTRRICVADTGFSICSIASEIISFIVSDSAVKLKSNPIKLTMPDCPEPTSYGLTKGFYIRAGDIAMAILDSMNIDYNDVFTDIPEPVPHDIPGDWFDGPF